MSNIHEISRYVRCKNREKYVPKKTIIRNNIYMVRQFIYVRGVVVISLFIGKKINDATLQFFSLKTTPPNPNMKTMVFHSCIDKSQWANTLAKNLSAPTWA